MSGFEGLFSQKREVVLNALEQARERGTLEWVRPLLEAFRDRPEEDPALRRLVDGDGQLWRCGSRCRHKNCMQRLVAFHYDWLCTTARKAERLMAATKAQDLVNMDRKHGGGQAKGAKLQANREQVARAQDGQITPGCLDIQEDPGVVHAHIRARVLLGHAL